MKKAIFIAGMSLMLLKLSEPKALLEVYHDRPETLSEMIERIVGKDASLVEAIISVESNFNSDAVSHTGDYGLMQVNKYWWEHKFDWDRILEPEYNVKAGYYILTEYIKKSDNIQEALKRYNGGSVYPHLVNRKHYQLYNEYLF